MSNDKARALTRHDLYEAVWTEPISRLAPRCDITDVGLAKLCRRLSIPVPGRGYWRKLETGARVPRRPALPRLEGVSVERVVIWMRVGGAEPKESAAEIAKVAAVFDIAALHPIAVLALSRLRRSQPDRKDDIVAPGCLGIRVLPDTVDRAVLIADALIGEFEHRGCVVGTGSDGRGRVALERDEVAFEIREDPVTGRLSVVWDGPFGGRKTWSDGARKPVETQLGRFVGTILGALAELRTRREEKERRETVWARIEERAADRKREAEREKIRAKAVRAAMVSWEKAARLRTFAAAVEAATRDGQVAVPTTVDLAHIARELADRIDPLAPVRPPELATCDYIGFDDWHEKVLQILGKDNGYKNYAARQVFELRMTPEEAAREIDWDASRY